MRKLLVIGLACFALACEEPAVPTVDGEPVDASAEPAEPGTDATAAAEPAEPAEPAAPELPERRFVEVKGDVKIDGNPAAVDMEIGAESTLETGKDGWAVITVSKGSTIEVRKETKLTFGKTESAEISVALAVGALWSFMAPESSYEVVTENAVAGVRGTIFFVQVEPKKKKKQADKTYVCACDGDVHIRGTHPKSFDDVVSSPNVAHKSFDIITRGKKQKKRKAKRRNHTDAEKMALMPYMEKTK